jgi:hypothetical protein
MGSWSVSCGISNIAITSGNKCVLLPLKKSKGSETRNWQAACLPIFGEYNDYGGIEEIDEDDNTKLIEEHFGITIAEFCEFLVDGKFTYERDEADEILQKINKIDNVEEMRFMWIDRQVYDFMIINHDKYYKGYNNYGTPEMLKLLGFEFVEKSDSFKNYDPKRFNQLWKKGDVEVFSDNINILKNDRYVYHFGKGDESSIETYFEVPKELEYLKNISKAESWRLMGDKNAKYELGYILGNRYDHDFDLMDEIIAMSLGKKEVKTKPKELHKKYYADLENFGDRIVHFVNINSNLHAMSGQLVPHILYLTPQCGEYEKHQIILEKFAEINKSYITDEDDE